MIKFLTKGLLRDRTRSFFPVLVITISVAIVVFASGFMTGMMNNLLLDTAVILSGHEKIVTRAYNEESMLMPNDLALLETDELIDKLEKEYPNFFWTPRITFAGLLDVPDEKGETKSQGPVIGMGIDFFTNESRQVEIWELERNLVNGTLPVQKNDVLISSKLADKLNVYVGEQVTFIGSTMDNAFTTYNYNIVGTFNLRKGQTDRQLMLVDISGAREALDMDNAASAIFGFTHDLFYDDAAAVTLRTNYNNIESDTLDIFSPYMLALRDGNQMGTMVDMSNAMLAIMGSVFLVIVMVVLWNMGLMNGLRRYGEVGLRLAIGEPKGHVYRSLILEAVIIGLFGTVVGTGLGLSITYYVQENGIDYTKGIEALSNSSVVMPNIFYAQVTPDLFYIGFFPGVLATVFGTMLAGLAIYKREMSQLFKELET
ncbi:MAG: ABC transporter permease [Candidatus Neomarinimicrobiota bacterium]|nr:MAG: ABC transporter permease [bacterium]|tara:strand:- start:65 stop:1348 length:1284 start_codon:yes stop_codon:yes gene_type:complete